MEFEDQANNNIAQINVTPFVDVMLVLLVIFMVTTPIMQQGVNVELPSVEAGALAKQTEREREIEARGRTVAGDGLHIPF